MYKYVYVSVSVVADVDHHQLTKLNDEQYQIVRKFAELVKNCELPENFKTFTPITENVTCEYYLNRLDLSEEDRQFASERPIFLYEYIFNIIPYGEYKIIKITNLEFLDVNSIETII